MPILEKLARLEDEKPAELEAWFADKRAEHLPMLTTSVDLRHSGKKLAPVDANIYPAGFQNLSTNAQTRAAAQFQAAIEQAKPGAKNILIFPEAHTRNLPYLDNLASLQAILQAAGFDVAIGTMLNNEGKKLELHRANGHTLEQYALEKQQSQLQTICGFVPDVVLLNNDCTPGVPELLKNIAQPILPTPCMGWFQRKKSDHFSAYEALASHFAHTFELDPWCLSAYFDCARDINFKSRIGTDDLAKKVDTLITKIQHKYDEYGIQDTPYIYVKADSGTYGMGIMLVHDGSELLELNKKQRNKMHVVKESTQVENVVLQEGVPTQDNIDGDPAEPMIYLVDGMPIGGMFRINSGRDALGNLNASGMSFEGMCDSGEEEAEGLHKVAGCDFSAYGIIAGISALAVGVEKKNLDAGKQADMQAQCV